VWLIATRSGWRSRMSEPLSDLIAKIAEVSNIIHQRTVRNKVNWMRVEVGSSFYEAIQRGEFRWMGVEPDSGVPIEPDG
jgi:hypothetical protein